MDALESVLNERKRQDELWGEQNHEPFTWLTILMEEVGEFAHDALGVTFGPPDFSREEHLRAEAVQVAAIALAIVESLDRNST